MMRKTISIAYTLLMIIFIAIGCREDNIWVNDDAQTIGGVSVAFSEDGASILAESLTFNSAEVKATIKNEMSREIEECGAYYSTIPGFSIGQAQKVVGNVMDNQSFIVKLAELKDGTTYYFRFYVKHSGGLSYSALTSKNQFQTKLNYRVPDVEMTSASSIYEKIVEAKVVHNGYYDITECGIYYGESVDQMKKLKATSEKVVDGVYTFKVAMAAEELVQDKPYYFKAYAVNQLGEGVSVAKQIVLERAREYPVLSVVKIQVLSRTSAKMIAKVETTGFDAIKEYGYYLNGKKVLVQTGSLNGGETFEVEINNLVMGRENAIYPYAVNSDGESREIEPTLFYTGIIGKNEADKNLVYLELPPIMSNGKSYYFLDRNLGAQAAHDTGDDPSDGTQAGWVFQWGRDADGHQLWAAPAIAFAGGSAQYPLADQYKGKFIGNATTYVWIQKITQPSYLTFWTNASDGGINNPCPEGFRVPTIDEIKLLFANKPAMKVVDPKVFRAASDGGKRVGDAQYWTCSVDPANAKVAAWQIRIKDGVSALGSSSGQGNFIRCVRVE